MSTFAGRYLWISYPFYLTMFFCLIYELTDTLCALKKLVLYEAHREQERVPMGRDKNTSDQGLEVGHCLSSVSGSI